MTDSYNVSLKMRFGRQLSKWNITYRFLAEFYQSCWEITKEYLMALFKEFHHGGLPLYNLNFGMIILLPDEPSKVAHVGNSLDLHIMQGKMRLWMS
jgi:hypothetical protein